MIGLWPLMLPLQDGCGHVSMVFTVSSKAADRNATLQTLRFAALVSRLGCVPKRAQKALAGAPQSQQQAGSHAASEARDSPI